MRRTGIDLSPSGCVVVDVDTPGRWRKPADARSFRVRDFAAIGDAGSLYALTAELKALVDARSFPRRAWVNLWDVSSIHQYRLLPSAPPEELKSSARHHGASMLGLEDEAVTLATAIGATRGHTGREKTELSFFAASTEEVRRRLRPIVAAGFEIEGVTTPCGALWSLAKLRRAALPGEVHTYVALGRTMSALAIFSSGFLLYAKDLAWGYADSPTGPRAPVDREKLADRLARELRQSFLYLKQYWDEDVSQVLLCGDMPEIRSLTAPLITRLNLEVETLDTLDGIDTTDLPDGFGEKAAALRLACAVAADPPPANLLPVKSAPHASETAGKVLAAGLAAAVALVAFLYGRASVTRQEREPYVPESQTSQAPVMAPVVAQEAEGGREVAAVDRREAKASRQEAESLDDAAPMPEPVVRPRSSAPKAPADLLAEQPSREPGNPRNLGNPRNPGNLRNPGTPRTPQAAGTLEPVPVVRSILYSPQRQVALLDGRLVRVGDVVGSFRVSAIERETVIMENPNGVVRRLGLQRRGQ